jgi:hypothetical protein
MRRHQLGIGRRILIGLTAIVALGVAGGIAYAGIPGGNGVISGCYAKSGALRVIDSEAGAKCSALQKPISWNQQGPQGQPGSPGRDGVSGYDVLIQSPVRVDPGELAQSIQHCYPGHVPISGGWYPSDANGTVTIDSVISWQDVLAVASAPYPYFHQGAGTWPIRLSMPTNGGAGWLVTLRNLSDEAIWYQVYAVCISSP